MTPTDRMYTKEHEWVKETGEGLALGISAHAQEALGDIVFAELPAVGDTFDIGDSFAVVESVKAVSNVYTPVAGEILAVNSALEDTPELLNEAPYENHLAIIKAELADAEGLMSAAQYDAFVLSEA